MADETATMEERSHRGALGESQARSDTTPSSGQVRFDCSSSSGVRLTAEYSLDAAEEFQHRRVAIRGRFDHDREILIGPTRKREFDGYLVVTPFVRNVDREPGEGPAEDVLVLRGFIRKEYAPKHKRSRDEVRSAIPFIGCSRLRQSTGLFRTGYRRLLASAETKAQEGGRELARERSVADDGSARARKMAQHLASDGRGDLW